MQLFQTMLTSPSGMTTGLVGEEMLLWLNLNFVAVTKEEVKGFAGKQEPWLEEGFWKLLVRLEWPVSSKTRVLLTPILLVTGLPFVVSLKAPHDLSKCSHLTRL